jgi:hypothetical protein
MERFRYINRFQRKNPRIYSEGDWSLASSACLPGPKYDRWYDHEPRAGRPSSISQREDKAYLASAKRFKEIEDKAGLDTIIAVHAALDNMFEKVDALLSRKPGDPHLVSKDDVDRFSTIVIECAKAKLAWANSK